MQSRLNDSSELRVLKRSIMNIELLSIESSNDVSESIKRIV